MANSTTHIDTLVQSQASKEVTINAFFDACSPATVYGRRASTTTGLTWGYYGGNVTLTNGTMSQIANGTLTLTASNTNYIVAAKATGAVSVSTANTNWNNTTDYWRLYSVVTGTDTVTSYTDVRQVALYTGMAFTGAMIYQGSWDASTNTPTLASGTGTKGSYYVVSVSGTTTIDGVSLWSAGDIIVFNGAIWQKIDASLSAQEMGNLINSATEKSTPADADMLGLMDSEASNILKKLSWSNIKAALKTYFNKIYASLSGATFTGSVTATGFSGPLNGTVGATTPAAGNFTTLGATGNVTMGDASTDTVMVNGRMGVGGAAATTAGFYLTNSALIGSQQHGVFSNITGASDATAQINAFVSTPATAASAYTSTLVSGYQARDAVKGAGSTITNLYGVYIADQTKGTNNYGITSLVSSGTNKWNIYASGTAPNYFAGVVNVEDGTELLPSIVNNGDPNTGIWFPAADTVAVSTAGEKRIEVAPDGDLVLSNTTGTGYRKLWFTGDGDAMASSRIGAITKNYDSPYDLNIYASYGTNATPASTIFYRYNGGEYFRIASNGCTFKTQAEPATVNSSATLTAANLAAKIITSTSASAVTATLPTGTYTEAVIGASQPAMAIDTAIEWSIINTGPNAVTVAANTDHTTVGGLVVAAGTSGRFCTRKTATNTFITYRLS